MTDIEKNKSYFEVILETKTFAKILGFASSVIEKRNVSVELNNIKLVSNANLLEVGATDMDLYLHQEINVQVISEGSTTVSTQTLLEVINKISDKQIKLKQLENNELEIKGLSCCFKLVTLPAYQFPDINDFAHDFGIKILCDDLARLVEYTSFAVSTEETRYNLNGIYMHVIGKSFCCAATDAHRLSSVSINIEEEIKEFGVIIPSKTSIELLKILKNNNSQSEVEIFVCRNKIKFKNNNFTLISKLIDATFPEYSCFIPKDNDKKLIINRRMFLDSIDRVSCITVEKFRAIKISINEKGLYITGSSDLKGFASEELQFSDDDNSYCKFSGSKVSIGFNPSYVKEILRTLNDKMIEVHLKDHSSPLIIKGRDSENENFVVMPLNI